MIHFVWPWLLLLLMLPLPLAARRWLPPSTPDLNGALRAPFFARLTRLERGVPARYRFLSIPLPGPFLVWILLLLAAAQPQWVDPGAKPSSGRDMMLVIDISGSMRHQDFSVAGQPASRLQVIKQVFGPFIEGREGDRLGLILFGAKPYVRAPLTHDMATLRTLLEEAEVALAGEYTAVGDAIGLAIKRLRALDGDSRVIFLVTDGANNQGRLTPLQAAQLAADEGIRIYAMGIGTQAAAGPNPYGVWSASGAARFERELLRQLADRTAGFYFDVVDYAALEKAARRLDAMEPTPGPAVREYLAQQLYPWPLALALLVAASLAWRARRRT